jgi:hypothetical protein
MARLFKYIFSGIRLLKIRGLFKTFKYKAFIKITRLFEDIFIGIEAFLK